MTYARLLELFAIQFHGRGDRAAASVIFYDERRLKSFHTTEKRGTDDVGVVCCSGVQ
jgi:hypothetical protein